MKPRLFWVTDCVAIMARPIGGSVLAEQMVSLADEGVDRLVSLLTDDELAELRLDELARACDLAGVRLTRFPIADREAPSADQPVDVEALVMELAADVRQQHRVVAHCRAGIGRSGLLAAAVLVAGGQTASEAWQLVAAARGCAVPDTSEQRDWVNSFADRIQHKAS